MANVNYSNLLTASGIDPSFHSKGHVIQWTPLTQTGLDTGQAYDDFGNTDRSIQLNGVLGAAGACVIEGSNDNVNYFLLKDQGGAAMTLTALGIYGFQPGLLPRFIRPRITAGDGTTSLTVILLARRQMNS